MTHALETKRLILRRPAPHDWEPFRDFLMSDRSSGVGGSKPLGAAWRVFAAELGHWTIRGFGMWTVTVKGDDAGIGMVGPWYPADWPETEVGWMIWSAAAEGQGIAYEAAKAAISHAWQVLQWDTIVSYVAHDNDRSAALARRLGAEIDPDASQPRPDTPCNVFRHPRPEATI